MNDLQSGQNILQPNETAGVDKYFITVYVEGPPGALVHYKINGDTSGNAKPGAKLNYNKRGGTITNLNSDKLAILEADYPPGSEDTA